MAQNGIMTCLYLQKDLLPKIDSFVRNYPGLWKSRNHFVNAAVSRTLMFLKEHPGEIKKIW